MSALLESMSSGFDALPASLVVAQGLGAPRRAALAAVLPELMKCFPRRFSVAVVPRDNEDAVARRYGSQRWPTLLFFRDGQYVTAIAGMQDWEVYVSGVAAALAMPPSRPPTIGIPVVTQGGAGSSCQRGLPRRHWRAAGDHHALVGQIEEYRQLR